MANTTHGYPYPLGTDRLTDGDDVIHSLATAVDTQLGVAASGLVTTPVPGALNTAVSVTVTFPVGRFNVAPNVLVSANINNPHTAAVSATGVSATGVTVNGSRLSGALGAIPIWWLAHVI